MYNWGPKIVGGLTPEQQLMYMTSSVGKDDRTGKSTVKFNTVGEAQAYMALHRNQNSA